MSPVKLCNCIAPAVHGPIMRHALRGLIRHFNYFNVFNSEAFPMAG